MKSNALKLKTVTNMRAVHKKITRVLGMLPNDTVRNKTNVKEINFYLKNKYNIILLFSILSYFKYCYAINSVH